MCAINPISMAHQWRKPFCSTIKVRLREKGNGAGRSITPFPNGALMAQWHTLVAGKGFPEVLTADPCRLLKTDEQKQGD